MTIKNTTNNLSLEQKLTRLKEIQQKLESGTVPLTDSMTLLEEALTIKNEVEKELNSMQNRLVDLTKVEKTDLEF